MIAVHRVLDPAAGLQVPPGLCALAIMTKAPRAGQVKTRLSPPLTADEAAELNACFLRDTATAISSAVDKGHARGIGVYTPVGEENAYAEILPAHFELLAQRGDAFGERLLAAAEDLLAIGFESFCLIDSDSPTVPEHHFAEAVRFLRKGGDRMVFGPSDDGGYYLIGLKKAHRELFEGIDWSTERTSEQTMEKAKKLGLNLELLPAWYDVDDRATLQRLCGELLEPKEPNAAHSASETRTFLADLIGREGRERIWPAN